MDKKRATCDADRIEHFLSDQLSDSEQAEFEDHLNACDACRLELEMRAAEPDIWQRIRESLSARDADEAEVDAFGAGLPTPPNSETDGLPHSAGDLRTDEWSGRETAPQQELTDAVLQCLAPTDDPRMLGRFGGYEISGVIGCGGMGVVLKGFDAALNRYVAIKVLAPHLAVSGSARKRFAREAQAAAAVVHESVVAIHGVAESGDLPYFVMSYVRGPSLQKRLNEHGPLWVTEILRIAMQTAAGLTAAHAQGLVHRDIKPANILLADGVERVKITDFGLARAVDDASLTRTGVIPGTPQFMSPEQARGESVDARSDLFSLGSVIYAMCTGRPPFRAETSYGILRRITDNEPRPIREINSEIPEWLVTIINKLHAKDPAERFQSADEVADLLEACLAHVQQPTTVSLPESLCESDAKKQPRRRWSRIAIWAGSLSAACLVLVVATVLSLGDRSADQERNAKPPRPTRNLPDIPSKPTQDAPSPSAAWDDRVDEQIIQLDQNAGVLEQQAGQLWEKELNEQE